jgi:LysM repeat protein
MAPAYTRSWGRVKHPFVQHQFAPPVDSRTSVLAEYEQSFDRFARGVSRSGSGNRVTPFVKDQSMTTTAIASSPRYTVVLPGAERLAHSQPSTTVYIRRRLLAGAIAVAIAVVGLVGAGNVLANRGGVPASTSTVRPDSAYVVRAGDTMWSIAAAHRGEAAQVDYVDALIEVNGTSLLQIGQQIILP